MELPEERGVLAARVVAPVVVLQRHVQGHAEDAAEEDVVVPGPLEDAEPRRAAHERERALRDGRADEALRGAVAVVRRLDVGPTQPTGEPFAVAPEEVPAARRGEPLRERVPVGVDAGGGQRTLGAALALGRGR